MQTQPILVIGSTGKTGSRIERILQQRGHLVRGGSRRAAIPFDWDNPATWLATLDGVRSAYISYAPDLAFPGAPEKIAAFTRQAAACGAEHLVLLSGRNEFHAQACEEIVRDSGLHYTLVRASWFSQNFSEGHLLEPVLQGFLALPAGDVAEPFVDVDDIAEVAVAALTDPRHRGQTYELTGPRLLTFAEAMAEISDVSGLDVQYVPISAADFEDAMSPIAGPLLAKMYRGLCEEVFDGRNSCLSDGVQRALGRPPRDFSDFCRKAAASGMWSKRAAALAGA